MIFGEIVKPILTSQRIIQNLNITKDDFKRFWNLIDKANQAKNVANWDYINCMLCYAGTKISRYTFWLIFDDMSTQFKDLLSKNQIEVEDYVVTYIILQGKEIYETVIESPLLALEYVDYAMIDKIEKENDIFVVKK